MTKPPSIPNFESPDYIERRKAARIKRLETDKTEKPIAARETWRQDAWLDVHDLRRAGLHSRADDLIKEIEARGPGNPNPAVARKLTDPGRLAWRVAVKVDDIYEKWLAGRKRAPKEPHKGEAAKRWDGWYEQACNELKVDSNTNELKEAVRSRLKQGRPAVDEMRQRFKAEAAASIQDSITP
ncbi:hypothetical protein [Pseudorhodoplanes sp.]|uniref:hypothetical protein n=1 Tax=Pseudorhodoplanes sp. TaxID=1934341 RepID=UPI003D119460